MPARDERRYWRMRILLCLATSLAVTGAAYVCAFLNYRSLATLDESTELTRADLETLRQDVEAYRAANGRLPEHVTDLPVVKQEKVRTKEGYPVDQWGHGIHYEARNGKYRLYSNGKLGKPGPLGSYLPLVAGEPDPAAGPPPTFGRFLTDPKTIVVQAACILGGVVAFPLCLFPLRDKEGNRPTLLQTFVLNVVTAVFATFAALVIGMLHILPGGH